jgi:hypothetical protein
VFAARVFDGRFDLEILDRTKRDAPALREGERDTNEVAGKPGPDGGR